MCGCLLCVVLRCVVVVCLLVCFVSFCVRLCFVMSLCFVCLLCCVCCVFVFSDCVVFNIEMYVLRVCLFREFVVIIMCCLRCACLSL